MARSVVVPAEGFIGPVKRSVTIAGHATSVSLEPVFWRALEGAALARSLPLSALVAQISAHVASRAMCSGAAWAPPLLRQ